MVGLRAVARTFARRVLPVQVDGFGREPYPRRSLLGGALLQLGDAPVLLVELRLRPSFWGASALER